MIPLPPSRNRKNRAKKKSKRLTLSLLLSHLHTFSLLHFHIFTPSHFFLFLASLVSRRFPSLLFCLSCLLPTSSTLKTPRLLRLSPLPSFPHKRESKSSHNDLRHPRPSFLRRRGSRASPPSHLAGIAVGLHRKIRHLAIHIRTDIIRLHEGSFP